MKYRYTNASNQEVDATSAAGAANTFDDPYPDTRMLVDAIRAQTPPELQYCLSMMASIELFSTTTRPFPRHFPEDYRQEIQGHARGSSSQVTGGWQWSGNSGMPLTDYIEIGVFSGKKDEEKPLYLKKEKLTEERKTFVITVDQQPTLAGIDPYNKLIDRNADDNMIDITNQ